jgi:asparagine synthase (glutamine-hydrolysing)
VAPDIRRWADDFRAMAHPHNATEQLLFSMLTYDFGDAFDLKQQVYGPAMAHLRKANPFQPTNIGPRTRDQVPAAIIRKLFDTWLVSNCLSLGDRVSMAVGVETRMPFLDLKLIELVMAWRYNNPDHNLGQKAWLKAALKDVLPAEVLARPKAGFQPPVREWISAVVSEHAGILRDGKLVEAGVLDKTKLDFIIHEWPQTDWAAMYFVYKLVLLEMWFQQVVAP